MATAFEGDEPNPEGQYNRTHYVCVEMLDYCDDRPVPRNLVDNKCSMCKAVVADVISVAERKKEWDHYRTKRHIYDVLDSVCSSVVLRMPPELVTPFSNSCADIVEEYEHEIVDAYISDPETAVQAICGPGVAKACPASHDKYSQAYLSIFHQVPRME